MVQFTTNNMENVLFVTNTNFNAKCTLCLGSFVEMKELDPAGAAFCLPNNYLVFKAVKICLL